ncbi:MAG: hypothetical protein R2733_20745 [Acidimicrobiales bacterium]
MHRGDWATIRSAGVTLLVGLLAAVLAGTVSYAAMRTAATSDGDSSTAVVELGVTQEVSWPFFDVVFQEAVLAAQEQRSSVEETLGDMLFAYRVEQPEALLLVTIEVEAADPDSAVAGAEHAAEQTLAQLEGRRTAPLDAAISTLEDRLVEVEAEIAEAERDLDAALAATDSAVDATAAALASVDRDEARNRLDSYSNQRRSIEGDLDGARLERSLLQPQVAIVGRSAPSALESASSNKSLAVAVGVAAAAGLAAVALSRSQGRVRSAAHAASELGIPALDASTSTAEVERALHRAWSDGHDSLLVDQAGKAEPLLPDEWLDGGRWVYPISPKTQLPLIPADATGDPDVGRCRGVVVFGERHRTTLRRLRTAARRHEAAGVVVVAIVLR